jgi:hypothetical protein
MPNWCMNTVEFEGTPKQIQQVKDAIQKDALFGTLCPMPESVFRGDLGQDERKECEDKGIDNWYDWSVANWGTKWEASDLHLDDEGQYDDCAHVTVSFSTAWTPPVNFYENLYENMNYDCDDMGDPDFKIRATYYEPGCDFIGIWENGQLLDAHYNILEQRAEDRAEELEEVQEWYEDGKKELNLG